MVIIFTHEDLISFGTYMISEARSTFVANNLPEGVTLEESLKEANKLDIDYWMYLCNKQREKENESKERCDEEGHAPVYSE